MPSRRLISCSPDLPADTVLDAAITVVKLMAAPVCRGNPRAMWSKGTRKTPPPMPSSAPVPPAATPDPKMITASATVIAGISADEYSCARDSIRARFAMALTSGARLGPYEIQTAVGAGGMGEVYRARDTRLDRTVAIKVLSATLAADPLFRERFDREARAISALDHTNICTLYDLGTDTPPGTSEPVNFLVMQFVDGETLARRLERGPLKIAEVVRIAMEIASALDKAHRAGIVHRDLKPGNVMLTANGAKLLDFGLAKLVAPSPGVAAMTAFPTREMTADGTILSTFQYMAPEQLEGGDADARTDIFAFGTLVYEMTTGGRAFEGKTRTSLIAAIVQSDPPPISRLQPLTPEALEHVIRKCLCKDRDDRW